VASRDITEGRSTRAIAVDIGLNTGTIWQNTGNTYDCAIAGIPFLSAIRDDRPYERTTAPFRKQQFDSQRDPGEQSLSTWWLRSQSSFHAGEGIKFYDPLANPYSETLSTNSYRYKKSKGVEIFDDPGVVTLLRKPTKTQATTTGYSIETVTVSGNDRILLRETAALKITDGTTSAMTTISAGVSSAIYASCNDGLNAYYLDAANLVKVALTGGSTSSIRAISGTTTGTMAYVKQRLVVASNNKLYEFAANSAGPYTVTYSQVANKIVTLTTSINHSFRVGDSITVASIATSATSYNGSYTVTAVTPNTISYYHDNIDRAYESQSAGTITLSINTPIYTHPNSSWVWTSIAEGGSAIYAAGYAGAHSTIYKFTLDTVTGLMPTLTSGIIAATLPDGEVIHNIYVHLMSYIFIGTNKGVRVGTIDDVTGNITYGPLMIITERPVRGFDSHNAYVYASSSIYDETSAKYMPMIYRIDLATRIDNLRYAYQTDVYPEDITEGEAIGVCWLGTTNQLAFICGAITNNVISVATLGLYVQSATELYNSGWIETGLVRYNTLEPKNFKRVVGRGDFTYGSVSIQTRTSSGILYDVVQYDAAVGNPEVTITQPSGAQDSLGLRFTLYQSPTDGTKGPSFQGYQLKAVPATPRTRIITMPVMNFDTETDKYNTTIGYEGRAIERLGALENAESNGDVLTWQDFRTGEIAQVLIEEVKFTDVTPPDKRFTGYGGIITLTIRTV
jgi:hypothetical protein